MDNLKKAGLEFKKERDGLTGDLETAKKTVVGLTTEKDDL